MKSLEASELITSTAHDQSKLTLTAEAETYVTAGSPEAQAFAAVLWRGAPSPSSRPRWTRLWRWASGRRCRASGSAW